MSMLYIGHAWQEGNGVSQDLTRAEEWYQRAANAGSVMGLYALGRLYLKQRRFDDAKKAFRLGAARGYAPAMHFLGRMCFFGWGETDIAKAKIFLEDASALGNLRARRLLGQLLVRHHVNTLELLRGIFLNARTFVEFFVVGCTEGVHSERFQ